MLSLAPRCPLRSVTRSSCLPRRRMASSKHGDDLGGRKAKGNKRVCGFSSAKDDDGMPPDEWSQFFNCKN